MPMLMIRTNQAIAADQREAVLAEASRRIAQAVGKPEKFVMVSLHDGIPMMFGGGTEPAAYMEFKNIGLQGDQTEGLSNLLASFAEDWLNVGRERLYVEFADIPRGWWGFNGGTL